MNLRVLGSGVAIVLAAAAIIYSILSASLNAEGRLNDHIRLTIDYPWGDHPGTFNLLVYGIEGSGLTGCMARIDRGVFGGGYAYPVTSLPNGMNRLGMTWFADPSGLRFNPTTHVARTLHLNCNQGSGTWTVG